MTDNAAPVKETEPRLFIGGSRDGKWFSMEVDREYLTVHTLTPRSILVDYSAFKAADHAPTADVALEHYKVMFLRCQERQWRVMVLNDWTYEQMISQLLRRYVPDVALATGHRDRLRRG